MILLNCNKFIQGAYSIREIFIQLCDSRLTRFQKDNNLGLQQILDYYSLSDIKRAFRNISVNEYGYLYVPNKTSSELILRYLEYGGENVRATHLLSQTVNEINNLFELERRTY